MVIKLQFTMTAVESKMVESIGYIPADGVIGTPAYLAVRFRNHGLPTTYVYKGADAALYEDFKASESKGRFVRERILPAVQDGSLVCIGIVKS